MRHIVVKPHLTIEKIAQHRDATKNKRHYRWWQVIWLAAQGTYQAEAIAEIVGLKLQSVYNLLSRYNRKGPEGLTAKSRGGCRRRHFSPQQEQELLQSLHEQASRGEITTAGQVKRVVEQALGRQVSPAAIYTLLRRAEWRKVAPRPRHPDQYHQAQEDFKKNIQSWSKKPSPPFSRKIGVPFWSCFRMKAGSVAFRFPGTAGLPKECVR